MEPEVGDLRAHTPKPQAHRGKEAARAQVHGRRIPFSREVFTQLIPYRSPYLRTVSVQIKTVGVVVWVVEEASECFRMYQRLVLVISFVWSHIFFRRGIELKTSVLICRSTVVPIVTGCVGCCYIIDFRTLIRIELEKSAVQ